MSGAPTAPAALAPPEVLRAWDLAHVWHPFTPHSVYPSEAPLCVVEGRGFELVDVHGRAYLDGVSSLWCNVFGHRHPRIDAAVRAQLDRIAHCTLLGNTHDVAIVLARRLASVAPAGLDRVFFSDDGSTAVEAALKIAVQYQRQRPDPRPAKQRILALGDAYHGDTVGAVSVGGIELYHARFAPLLFPALRVPGPAGFRSAPGPIDTAAQAAFERAALAAVAEHAAELAAVIVEPGMQGAAGMIPLPKGFLARLRAACDTHDVLLVADEVAMGLGRTGRMWACDHEGVRPDLLCTAKGLTGGYLPLAATLATERIFQAFLGPPEQGRTFFHGHTFSGNPLGCAAALATLELFQETGLLDRLPARIEAFAAALAPLRALPWTADLRQLGLAVGVELWTDPQSRRPFPARLRAGMKVAQAALAHGVFLRPLGDVLVLMPPVALEQDGLERLAAVLAQAMAQALPALAAQAAAP